MALALLKRYEELARENSNSRGVILKILANKPQGFESGTRLGYWQSCIYHHIPVKEEHISFPQSKQNDHFNHPHGDIENSIGRSDNYSTVFGLHQQITTAFGSLCQIVHTMLWNSLIKFSPSIKHLHDTKLMHMQTLEITRMMCAGVIWCTRNNPEYANPQTLKEPLFTALKLGIPEIVREIIKAYSYSVAFQDEDRQELQQIVILCRHEKVLDLFVNQLHGPKERMLGLSFGTNKRKENMLHLAGKLVPSHEVSGAALEMQQQFQWFKSRIS